MSKPQLRVGLLWPGNPDASPSVRLESTRLAGVAQALCAHGLACEPVVYRDDFAERVRALALTLDAVLVWVNPIEANVDRRILDAMLADVAAAGVFVSAHPDTIQRIGTKDVLYRTREMSWGCDTRLYRSHADLCEHLPSSLAAGDGRVLKQHRGNGGEGVWKVARIDAGAPRTPISPEEVVAVRHARRGSTEERMRLMTFIERCRPYFDGGSHVVDQVYQPRLTDGMVRCYLVRDRVEGFGVQEINALFPAPRGAPATEAPQPGPRLYFPPTRPDLQPLKQLVESKWVGEMCRITELATDRLPLIWDLDFLYGPKDAAGHDTFVLCEINVSCVFPFPDSALAPLAAALRTRLESR